MPISIFRNWLDMAVFFLQWIPSRVTKFEVGHQFQIEIGEIENSMMINQNIRYYTSTLSETYYYKQNTHGRDIIHNLISIVRIKCSYCQCTDTEFVNAHYWSFFG